MIVLDPVDRSLHTSVVKQEGGQQKGIPNKATGALLPD